MIADEKRLRPRSLPASEAEEIEIQRNDATVPATAAASYSGQSHPTTYGALPGEWEKLGALGLIDDLLPVVSDPTAVPAPESAIKQPGKLPSIYRRDGFMVGIGKWTEHHTTPREIAKWSKDDRLGICLNTRLVRAIDVDVDEPLESYEIETMIAEQLGFRLPIRRRSNSSKFLVLFKMPGDFTKRRFKTAEGVIEFLAGGQQAVICGIHPSGARYEFDGGLPDHIPQLSDQQFEDLWALLNEKFGTEASVEARKGIAPVKPRSMDDVNDPLVDYLEARGLVLGYHRSGRLDITCPFADDHTTESGNSSTSYFPAGVGGFQRGHFDCKHSHCSGRTDGEFKDAIGWSAEGFEEIDDETPPPPTAKTPQDINALFADLILTDEDVAEMADAEFLIENMIVRSSLHIFVAPANGGKTTLFTYLCEELAAIGMQILYVNADANPADLKRHQGHARQHGYAVLAPDAKVGKSPKDIVAKMKTLNDSGSDLSNLVVVLDTLKKFANMIDKNSMRAFMALMRGLTAKGATVIMLAHTNKHAGVDGKLIFEGTGDVRNDADNLIYLESSKDDATKLQEITTRPDKVRATFEPVSYVIDFNNNRKVSRSGTVIPVMSKEEKDVIRAAETALQAAGKVTQTTLVNHIQGLLPGIGARKVIETIRKRAYGDGRTLDVVRGENNALLFSIRGYVEKPNADGFDDLANHGQQ